MYCGHLLEWDSVTRVTHTQLNGIATSSSEVSEIQLGTSSSAAAKGVFLIYRTFSHQQQSSLDYIFVFVMFQYNKK